MTDEIRCFVELMDDEVQARGLDPDVWSRREERRLCAVLHAQVQQFFDGLESALGTPGQSTTRPRLLQVALARATEHHIESESTYPEMFDLFAFLGALADRLEFDAAYDVGFAPDGSVSILTGPDLPAFPAAGVRGGREHDAEQLRTSISLATYATHLAARIAVAVHHVADNPGGTSTAGPQITARPDAGVDGDTEVDRIVAQAHRHFRTWWSGSEFQMVEQLAALFARRGLLRAEDDLARAMAAAHLMTLHCTSSSPHAPTKELRGTGSTRSAAGSVMGYRVTRSSSSTSTWSWDGRSMTRSTTSA